MKTRLPRTGRVAVAALSIGLATLAVPAPPAGAAPGDLAGPDGEISDLAELIVATAPYHDVNEALEDGWEVEPMCMDYPDGYYDEGPGTMGHHFFNAAYILDGGHVEPSQPELLLYEKRADGSWRLNAVEYVIPARDHPPTAEPPTLFGQEFRFYPEVGSAGIWGLHVWIWRHNPHGLYANVNPRVSCEHADMSDGMTPAP